MTGDSTLSWRTPLFTAARIASHGADALARVLVYAAAGLLTTEQVAALVTRRWEDFGADRQHMLAGLERWESEFYQRFLKQGERVLVVGCGSGRELIALRREGYRADGVELAASAVARARAILTELGIAGEVHRGSMEAAPPAGTWDACIFSWYCYSYIPERTRRVAALRAARERLPATGRILLSYVRRGAEPRSLPRAITATIARLTASARRPEATDVVELQAGGLHFEHQFVSGEIEAEARAAGLRVVHHHSAEVEMAVLAD